MKEANEVDKERKLVKRKGKRYKRYTIQMEEEERQRKLEKR